MTGPLVLVTGGRKYTNRLHVYDALDAYHQGHNIALMISGGAPGVDWFARQWCHTRGVHMASVDGLWKLHGKQAGPIRNAAMLLLRPDVVLAFPGHKGTRDMIEKAQRAGVPVIEVDK